MKIHDLIDLLKKELKDAQSQFRYSYPIISKDDYHEIKDAICDSQTGLAVLDIIYCSFRHDPSFVELEILLSFMNEVCSDINKARSLVYAASDKANRKGVKPND